MDVSVGKEIDGYQILDVLGRGGMGVVYKAEDLALSRKVALKMIDPALAGDESFLRRFRAEARALARVDSPYIVSVHALRQTDFGLFIVMEYVEGGTIADIVCEGPMPWTQALPLVKQMLHAFDHAHGVGVVHRDIKPRNIMLTPDGVVKVTDFGLAKLHQQNVEATVTQGIAGTLFYMSPEQVKGQRDLDHRADLYSLGMTIYEMLAGQVPLDRSESEYVVLKRIVEEAFPPPTQFVPDLPDALVSIVMKALEKDPAKRYQSAREMLNDLAAFEGSQATTQSASNELKPAVRSAEASVVRSPLLIGAAAMLIVLLAAAGFLGYRAWFSSAPSALLSVTTMPEGVTVYLGDDVIGETPLSDWAVEQGPLPLRLVKDGYVPVDTTLFADTAGPLRLDLQLAETSDARSATGIITSIPGDADVWINGRQVGRTPYTLEEAAPGRLAIVLQKEGYEDWERRQELVPGEIYTIAATLQRAAGDDGGNDRSTPPPRTSTGTLTVEADAGGRLAVDGRPVSASGPLTLETGTHTVTCGEPPHHAETSVTVAARRSHVVTCYFRSSVNVVTTMADGTSTWASIWINGESRGLAPSELKLDPGTYRISVQRDGFDVLDEEKTLVLKPGFEPQTYPLAFQIKKK